jgi:hypothetical protein
MPATDTLLDILLAKYPAGSPEWAQMMAWLMGYADLEECEGLSSLSTDSLKRNHSDKIHQLSPRRQAMRRLSDCSARA